MGREVRRVSPSWKHPKNSKGKFVPLYKDSLKEAQQKWDEAYLLWKKGFYQCAHEQVPLKPAFARHSYRKLGGDRPKHSNRYMPHWSESEKTHWQMYSTVSEGIPLSPPMPTPEALAQWLADNEASAFGAFTTSYEEWLKLILYRDNSCRHVFVTSLKDLF